MKNFLSSTAVRFLNFLGKYTKTDMVYLAKGGFWMLLSQGAATLSGLAITIIFANLLPKETYGNYRLALSIISVLTIFTLPGITNSIIRSVAKGHGLVMQKIANARIAWGLLGSVVALGCMGYYLWAGNDTLAIIFVCIAGFLPFFQTFFIYSSYYKGKENFKRATLYDAISRIFQAIALIVVVLVTRNLVALVITFLAGQAITNLFFYLKTLRDEKLVRMENDDTAGAISYGKKLSLIGALGIVADNADKFLVTSFLGAESLAIYHVALSLPLNIALVLNIISGLALPKFSKKAWDAHERASIRRKLLLFFGILIIPMLGYLLLVPFVLPFVFPGYEASVPLALLFGALILVMPLNSLILQIFRATQSVWRITTLQSVSLVALAAVFMITYMAGVIGAGMALVASEVLVLVLGVIFLATLGTPNTPQQEPAQEIDA